MRIGIISDTHGLLRPEALAALAGVDHILHAGDIGEGAILERLGALAPVTSVEGNNDDGEGTSIVRTSIGSLRILLTHILPRPSAPDARVLRSLAAARADLVIFGHSHLPHNEVVDGVRYFNPASAGPRRFDFPVSLGIIEEGQATHVALDTRSVEALQRRMNQMQ